MPASRPSRLTAGVLLGMALLLLFTVATVSACGSSSPALEGTWIRSGGDGAMVIKKSGDAYDVTVKAKESDASGVTIKGTMNGDTLELRDPSGADKSVVSLTVSGDKLTMKSGTNTETFTRK